MRRAFTLIEVLVATVLLAMLVTILTMVFNQSSIAWRTGTAAVADLDDIRDNMAEIREEADNAFVWNNKLQSLTGLWKEDGTLRDRACDAASSDTQLARVLKSKVSTSKNRSLWDKTQNMVSVGQTGNVKSRKTYTVNVKSAGPDREFDTYDDIWSWPDDFE